MNDHEMQDALRPCGVTESALFDYLDVPESVATRHAFARHLTDCAQCAREVESYRSLYARLSGLRAYAPRTLELRPDFNARVMAQVPHYGPLAVSAATAGRRGWFERLIGTPERLRMGLGLAGFSFVGGAALIAAVVTSLGGPQRAVAQGLSEAVRVGVGLLNAGVGQIVAAAHASDVLLSVSRLLKPLWNAAVTVSGAYGPEFWLASTLVSVLSWWGLCGWLRGLWKGRFTMSASASKHARAGLGALVLGIVLAGLPAPSNAKVTVVDTTTVRRETLVLGKNRDLRIGSKGDTTIVYRGKHGRGGHLEISQRGIIVDESDSGGDVVRMGDDVHIKPGERISGDVVSIGGSVTVDGIVQGDAVSIGGDMVLGDSAIVAGDAVSIGGSVQKSTTAEVGGETVQVGVKLPSILPWIGKHDSDHVKKEHGFVKFLFWVVFYLVVFAFAALGLALGRDRISFAADYMRREPLITFLLGIFSPLIFFIGMILLMITIIGIPVALAVMFIFPVLIFMGWVVAGYRVGSSVRQNSTLDVRTVFTGLLVISAVHLLAILLRAIGVGGLPTLLLGIVGWGASLLAALTGLGAILGTRFRRAVDAAPITPNYGSMGGPGSAAPIYSPGPMMPPAAEPPAGAPPAI